MIKKIFSGIYNASPKSVVNSFIGNPPKHSKHQPTDEQNKTKQALTDYFAQYTVSNLKNISTDEFTQHIQSKIGEIDSESEGYSASELEQQRDLSIKFHWGHDHDFGAFKLDGSMGSRHITLMSNFISLFPTDLNSFKDKNILDIGCWTGGTTLLLSALGGKVYAIEEVKKYAEIVNFLANSFGIESKLKATPKSIYQCNTDTLYDKFDIAYFPGVIYHLSDPVLALRIIFNTLKINGEILIETAGINTTEPHCKFEGNKIFYEGDKDGLTRAGWNWFSPSPSALHRMLLEAGFEDIQSVWHEESHRVYAYAKKTRYQGICKAGLSVPDIK